MGLLNSRNSNFLFTIPKGWFFPQVSEMFAPILQKMHIPFASVEDYVNYTVQSITFPSIQGETLQQNKQDATYNFKAGFDAKRYVDQKFTVTFKTTESFLNYFIMRKQWEIYWTLGPDDMTFLPDLRMQILDHDEYLMMTAIYRKIVFSQLSDMDFSYSNNLPEFRTFTCDFGFTFMDIKHEQDG